MKKFNREEALALREKLQDAIKKVLKDEYDMYQIDTVIEGFTAQFKLKVIKKETEIYKTTDAEFHQGLAKVGSVGWVKWHVDRQYYLAKVIERRRVNYVIQFLEPDEEGGEEYTKYMVKFTGMHFHNPVTKQPAIN